MASAYNGVMDFVQLRHNMVIDQLVRRGIHDERVLAALRNVPREHFVPASLRDRAYDDCALPIGHEQTISQPYTVAFMCQEARLHPRDRVLEIGTGSGYGAAVLSELAQAVYTVERIDELYQAAASRLAALGYNNVEVYLRDGRLGLPGEAPFDAIVVAAGAEAVPEAYRKQVASGGRIVMPVGPPGAQQMVRLTRRGSEWQQDTLGGFGFVPLVGGDGQ
jgi:protein-L-isoaspartate(D-aspartate) O-methyltransferase